MEQLPDKKNPSRLIIFAAFAAIYVVWGSTYIAVLIALDDLPPFMITGMRFLIAGVLLFIFCLLRRDPLPDARSIGNLSFSGILMLFFGTGAVAWVEQYIPSGLAAIIVASVPLWFVLLDKKQWQTNFSNRWIILGLSIGFIGVIILFADKKSLSFSGDNMKMISFIVLTAGTICWAIGSLLLKYKPTNGSMGMKSAIQMMAAGGLFVIISLIRGEYQHTDWNSVSQSTIIAIIYLIIFGSLIAYMAYVWLLTVRSATVVGTYAYVNPVVAVFLGWLIADEVIATRQIIALGVILFGVVLVTLARKK